MNQKKKVWKKKTNEHGKKKTEWSIEKNKNQWRKLNIKKKRQLNRKRQNTKKKKNTKQRNQAKPSLLKKQKKAKPS